jgi:hypothetical protein
MADIIFLTKPGLFLRGEDGVISRSFFCQFVPKEVTEALSPDSVLWVVTKSGNRLSLQSRLRPDLIQRFDEGKMSGWYLVSCSVSFGGHLAIGENGAEIPGGLPSVPQSMGGLNLLDETTSSQIKSVYRATVRRTGLSLERDLNRRNLKDFVTQNRDELVLRSIDQIELNLRARFFESDLAIHAIFSTDSDVFYSSAKEVFSYVHGLSLRDLVHPQIESSATTKLSQKRHTTTVDCRLRQFTEDDFMARTMVWNPANYSPDKAKLGMLKTNLAEKRHQQMLRLLVDYLIDAGLKPVGSSSIDLAVKADGITHLFEIKSSTIDNYKDQALKGCGQLAEYSYVYNFHTGDEVRRNLIIENPIESYNDLGYVANICLLMGSNLIDFKFESPWPEKCQILKAIN